MNFLFLCDELSGYVHSCVVRLADSVPNARITLVAKPGSSIAPFSFAPHPSIELLDRSKLSRSDFRRLADQRPVFTYVSGWGDSDYRWTGRRLRGTCPVAMGIDNPWNGSARQIVLTRFLSGRIRRFASHAWVAGMYQYEYVRRLGFPRDRILTGLYTADNHRGESKRTDGSAGRAGKPKTLQIGRAHV